VEINNELEPMIGGPRYSFRKIRQLSLYEGLAWPNFKCPVSNWEAIWTSILDKEEP
jgi:hypothetical protein